MTDETNETDETEAEKSSAETEEKDEAKADKGPPLPEEDEQKLEHLDEEIGQARQHLKEMTHEGEETFIEEGGPSDEEETDNTIAPPG